MPTEIVSPLNLYISNKREVLPESGFCDERDLHPASPDLFGTLKCLLGALLPDLTLDETIDILEMRTRLPDDLMAELIPDDALLEQLVPKGDAQVSEE